MVPAIHGTEKNSGAVQFRSRNNSHTSPSPSSLSNKTMKIRQIEAEKAAEARRAAQRRIKQELERASREIRLPVNHKLQYSVDFNSKDIMVKVIDTITNEVIKELPPEQARRLRASIREFAGILIDRTI